MIFKIKLIILTLLAVNCDILFSALKKAEKEQTNLKIIKTTQKDLTLLFQGLKESKEILVNSKEIFAKLDKDFLDNLQAIFLVRKASDLTAKDQEKLEAKKLLVLNKLDIPIDFMMFSNNAVSVLPIINFFSLTSKSPGYFNLSSLSEALSYYDEINIS